MKGFMLSFAAILLATKSYGFEFKSSSNDRKPIEIRSDNGISCDQDAYVCHAKGNVHITQGGVTLRAAEVVAHLVKIDDSHQTLSKIEAKGSVVIETQDNHQRLTADHGIYDVAAGVMTFYGETVRIDVDNFWIESHHKMTFSELDRVARAEGHAVAFRDGNRVEASTLVAYLEKSPKGTYVVKRIDALQDVELKSGADLLMAGKIHHNPIDDTATAQGDVRFIRQDSILTADRVDAHPKAGTGVVTRGKSPVKMLLLPPSK